MKEMTFRTVGILPASSAPWHVREGGGHVWFVNEDPDVQPMCLQNGVMVAVVDVAEDVDAPLIQPKVEA